MPGCTCQTTGGRKRVCKDGPVFDYRGCHDGRNPSPHASAAYAAKFRDRGGGTFGLDIMNTPKSWSLPLGGISGKGLTLYGSSGNAGMRL